MEHMVLLVILLLGLLLPSDGFSQTKKTIQGTVSSASGPVIGATVRVKNSAEATVTDSTGFYIIQATAGEFLVFSSTEYSDLEIQVKENNTINVDLVARTIALDDVVVVGYGTQTTRRVTGAIAKVRMKETQDIPNTNVFQSLRGRVAGVQFTDNGRPGQSGNILIRGVRSLSGSNAPLIIVDGIFFNAGIQNINPNDIESMEVLKDASASAIYGSRAANGVILITSKKGKSEKPQLQVNFFGGFAERAHKVKLLTPERYIERMRDYNIQAGLPATELSDFLYPSEIANKEAGRVNDHWDKVSQNAPLYSLDVSISGKSKKTNYYLSGSYTDEKGLMLNDQMKRLTLRSNIENQIADWLTIGMNATFITRDESGVLPAPSSNIHPYSTLYYDDGEPQQFMLPEDQVSQNNPIYSALLTKNETIINNIFANFYGIVKIPWVSGLQYRINYSPNYRWDHNYNFFRQDKHLTTNTTSASKFHREDFDWVMENILSYSKLIGRNHRIDATALYGMDGRNSSSTTASASQFGSDILGWNNLGLATLFNLTSNATEQRGVSSMIRLNYGFKDRYLFTFTMRRDASSVFSANHKYALFPSGAISWVLTEEKFLENSPVLKYLKLRLSYGAVGNQAISPYQSLSASSITRYVFSDGGTSSLGVFPNRMPNDDLKWETTYTGNIGVDFEILKGRVGGSVELYHMNTENLLVQRSLPAMTGYPSVWTNLGSTTNKGIELTLNTINIKSAAFEWSSNFVFSRNKNAIRSLYGSDVDGDGNEDNDLSNRWFIGQPVNVAYDYVIDGIYQKGDAFPTGYKAGDVRVKDVNGDGIINAADRTIIGQNAEPKIRWGFGNTLEYKNLSLSFFINGMHGWVSQIDLVGNGLQNDRNVNRIDYGWWTEQNVSNSMPSLIYTNPLGHGYYVTRDFVRLQDLSLSFNFPHNWLRSLKLSNARIFLSGKNLLTFTDWPGADPESGATQDGIPVRRIYSLGFNLSF